MTAAAPLFARSVARHSLGWLAAANLVGLWLAVSLLWPAAGDALAPLTFGRWTPLHLNWQLYGWCALPIVGVLLAGFLPATAAAGRSAGLALAAWSAALALGGAGWLGGSVSGKLFLDWHSWTRPLLPAAMLLLWGILFLATWRRWSGWSPRERGLRAALLAGLIVVPAVIFHVSSRRVYHPVNPDSGGATGAAILGSVLGIVAVVMMLPALLGVPARRSIRGFVVTLAAGFAVFAVVDHGHSSHHDLAQIVALGTLLLWLPLLPRYLFQRDWPAAARPWLVAFSAWWGLLLVTGWLSFLPGISEALKFTHALVAHAHLAMAGLLTSLNGALLVTLTRRPAPRGVFVLWQAGCAVYVAAMLTLGGYEVGHLSELYRDDPVPRLLLMLRLAGGAAMALASWRWLAAFVGPERAAAAQNAPAVPNSPASFPAPASAMDRIPSPPSAGQFPAPPAPGSRRPFFAAVAAVAATYFHFLLFTEFSWLETVRSVAPDPGRQRLILAGLGAGGILGSLAAARFFRPAAAPRQLQAGFLGCAAAATASLAVGSLPSALVAAGAAGLALGWLTVVLASSLRAATGPGRLGLAIGLGTGLAYAACNLPFVFDAAPALQTVLAAAVAALAVPVAAAFPAGPAAPAAAYPSSDYTRAGLLRWIAVLLGLVWLDSAAFHIIQHTPAYRAVSWHGPATLLGNAVVHLAAAVAAGLVLDRACRGRIAAGALLGLAAACLALGAATPSPAVPWLYTAGVSLYSVLLVEFPARAARARLAAAVYAVAGWTGSALGLGLAQDLHRIPPAFVALAAVLVLGLLALRARALRRTAAAVVAVGLVAAAPARAADDEAGLIARGREVYIAEGCLHCHSQYVRPQAPDDILRWGPASSLAATLADAPPLFGTRRQGPDLARVGNRRTAAWQRLHLADPRAVSPGSRMPSFAYLFSDNAGDDRGSALVAYLCSLGRDTTAARQESVAQWTPAATATPLAPAPSAALFARLCSGCHGPAGRGDGPLVARLGYPMPDWSVVPLRHAPADAPDLDTRLARIVKFGISGLPMAGHEYLSDAETLGLARHVRTLHTSDRSASRAAGPP